MRPFMPAPAERRAILRAVFTRDGGCVAPLLDPDCGVCKDRWGHERPRDFEAALTADHVRDQPGGFKPPFDPAHLVTLCWGHGVQRWELGHRPILRMLLRLVNSGVPIALAARQARAEWASDPRNTATATSPTSATGTTPSSSGEA